MENADYLHRVDTLRRIPAKTRFLSLEPLIGAIPNIDLTKIDWVIAGGESGPGARNNEEDWVRSIRDQCDDAGIPFFFKQWGGTNKKRSGRMLDNRTWDYFPSEVSNRQSLRVHGAPATPAAPPLRSRSMPVDERTFAAAIAGWVTEYLGDNPSFAVQSCHSGRTCRWDCTSPRFPAITTVTPTSLS